MLTHVRCEAQETIAVDCQTLVARVTIVHEDAWKYSQFQHGHDALPRQRLS